jgi:uncharacterized membrane protein
VTKYDWLLLVHILGAFLFLSGSIVAGVLALAAMQRERPSEIALLLRLVRPAVIIVGVGSLVALGLGIWLAEYVGYGLGRAWVVAAIVLWAASGALAGPAGKTMRHTREFAERLAEDGDRPSEQLRLAVRNPRAFAMNAIAFLLLLQFWVLQRTRAGEPGGWPAWVGTVLPWVVLAGLVAVIVLMAGKPVG